MTKTILITGSTDGIGLETARMLAQQGHHVLLHGRNPDKLAAAQAPVDLAALKGEHPLEDMAAYAQSKLALTQCSFYLAGTLGDEGPAIIAVNPGSLLASKMVREGFGVAGSDLGIGAGILVRAVLSEEFSQATGQYFDNDKGRFAAPHPDALDRDKVAATVAAIEEILAELDR